MGESITLEFDNKLFDHLSASDLYYKSTFWAKGDRIVAVVVVAFGTVSFVIVGPRWWTLIWFPLAICQWFNLSNPYRLKTRLFFQRNPKFLETYRLTFSDSGMHFKTNSIDSNIAWTHYSRVLEDKQVILLVYGSRMYTVIPKRVFRDSAQLAEFREMVSRHIAKEKQNSS